MACPIQFDDIKIREEFRRDGLAACFRADPILISLYLNCFKVKIINVGFPSIGEKEREICRNIIDLNAVLYPDVEFCLSGNPYEVDLTEISRIINKYPKTSAAIWLPVSDHFLKAGWAPDTIIKKIEFLIDFWKGKSQRPIDIALADITDNNEGVKDRIADWTSRIFSAGARNIILCDSRGIGTTDNLEKLFSSINKDFYSRIEFHAHNDNNEGCNNIKFLYDRFNIKQFSSSLFGLSERGTLIDTQELRHPTSEKAFNSLEKYFRSSIGDQEAIIKTVYPKGNVLTGAQYRLFDQNDSLSLGIGVTSNREVAQKVLKRNISNDELSYLKDLLLYNKSEICKIHKKEIDELVSKEHNVIQQYIKNVKPEFDILSDFYNKTLNKINVDNDFNMVCLGAGLGLYLIPILESIVQTVKNGKKYTLYLFDKNYYYLLFTKWLVSKLYGNSSIKAAGIYDSELSDQFTDNDLESKDLTCVKISNKLSLHFYRKDVEANDFLYTLKEITNSQKIDIVHAPAFFHQLKNPDIFLNTLTKELQPDYLISSVTFGDWLLFAGMFDDYKLHTPKDFFDNNKLRTWSSIYKNLNFSYLNSSLKYQTIFLQPGRVPFQFNKVAESDFLTTNDCEPSYYNLLQTWISKKSRSLFQLMPEEVFSGFKEEINQHQKPLSEIGFIHLGKLITLKIGCSVDNDYFKTINDISLFSEQDIRTLLRGTGQYVSGILTDCLRFLIVLPYLSYKGSTWFAELGSFYIRNDPSWKTSNENLIRAIFASVVRTKICSSDLTSFLFKDLIKHFNLPFYIKIVLKRDSTTPCLKVEADTSSYRYITIKFTLNYKPSDEITNELNTLKSEILNDNSASFSVLINDIQENKGQLSCTGSPEFVKLIEKIEHSSFNKIRSFLYGSKSTMQCEIDPSISGFLKQEFEALCDNDSYKDYLISLSVFLEYEVLLGLSRQQSYFTDKVGGIISWIYLSEDLPEKDEPIFVERLINLLAIPGDKITRYDYLKIISQHQARTALIAILIDSYAHNISAHSLAALKWWFELRHKILDKRFFVQDTGLTLSKMEPQQIKIIRALSKIEPQQITITCAHIENNSAKYYADLGLTDSKYNTEFYSLYDFLQFSQVDPQKLFCFTHSNQGKCLKKKSSEINGIVSSVKIQTDIVPQCFNPQFPVSLDYALYPFFRFLRDKGAFWSGVTRDMSFGGESKTWYKILWEDFANNPLYLGTIARSEGITKLNIHLSIKRGSDWETGEFVTIDLSLMEYEENIANNLTPKNDSQPATKEVQSSLQTGTVSPIFANYSKYAFIRLGEKFSKFREILNSEEYTVFLPGGVVGEHALFTILENTLRNIKHYTDEKTLPGIKENGIDLCIAINKERLKLEKQVSRTSDKPEELFRVSVWLGHPTIMKVKYNEKEISLWEKVTNSTRQPIIDKNGNPRMGGNTQDKACAAMLFNNKFNSVDQQEGKYNLYYPWLHFTTNQDQFPGSIQSQENNPDAPPTRIDCCNQAEYLSGVNNYESSITYENGYLKKQFFVWRSSDYIIIENEEDLKGENISRFRFVIVNIKEEQIEKVVNGTRQEGVVRVIYKRDGIDISNLINNLENTIPGQFREKEKAAEIIRDERLKLLYSIWLDNWLGKLKTVEAGLEKDGDNAKISFKEKSTGDGNTEVILQRSETNVISPIKLIHRSGDEPDKCNVRSHGNFWGKYFTKTESRQPSDLLRQIQTNGQKVVEHPYILYDFVEVVNTKVMIFDNRLRNRMPSDSNKVEVFRKQLKLTINEEISLDESNKCFKDILKKQIRENGKPNVLIVHLSYIEALGYKESATGFMNLFIEKELNELINKPNFLFIIISGRGRNSWKDEFKPEYLRFTLFKPVESFLHAIESAVSYNDNFDVKHNIIKVIFSS